MTTATAINVDSQVARNVRILMAANDLTQSEVADRIGLDRSAMTRAMRGQRHWKLDELQRIADVLNIDIRNLFDQELTVRSRCFRDQLELPFRNSPVNAEFGWAA